MGKKKKLEPRPMSDRFSDSEVFNVRLPRDLYDRLDRLHEDEDRSMAYLVRAAVQALLLERGR